jgi:alpha-tubulin suppressor-like RCC1 family protein
MATSNFFIKTTGIVMGFGENSDGQLGLGNTTDTTTPTTISGLSNIVQFASSMGDTGGYTLFLKSNGTVYSTGKNNRGQLGHGDTTNRTSPTLISGLSNVIKIIIGGQTNNSDPFSLFLLKDGTVKSCGNADAYQLGHGNTTQKNSPTLISGLSNVVDIAAGLQKSYFLLSNGSVKAVGVVTSGEYGTGSNSVTYQSVTTLSNVSGGVSISAGPETFFVIKSNGSVVATGSNNYGQLGLNNTSSPINTFTNVYNIGDAQRIWCNYFSTIMLRQSGNLAATGRGNYGSTGSASNRQAFANIINNVVTAYITKYTTNVVLGDGVVKGVGNNLNGLFGNNSTQNSNNTSFQQLWNNHATNTWTFSANRLQGNATYKHLENSTSLAANSYPSNFKFLTADTSGTTVSAIYNRTVSSMISGGSFYGYSNEVYINPAAGGDPYIYPLFGTKFKLPNVEKSLRLLDNCDMENRFFMNGNTYIVSKEESKKIEKEIKEYCSPENYEGMTNIGLEGGSFFENIYIENINNGKREFLYFNLKEFSYKTNIPNLEEKISIVETTEKKIKLFLNEKKKYFSVSFFNEYNGNIEIIISSYFNPQIKTSVEFLMDNHESDCNGLFSFYKDITQYYLKNIEDNITFNYKFNESCVEAYEPQCEEYKIGSGNKYIEII